MRYVGIIPARIRFLKLFERVQARIPPKRPAKPEDWRRRRTMKRTP